VLREMHESVIFAAPCSILGEMKTAKKQEPSGKAMASLASVVGLILVWGIVWANLPSKNELLSAQPPVRDAVASAVTELDLTIPGVPTINQTGGPHPTGASQPTGSGGSAFSGTIGGFSVPSDGRARQIAEVKCDAEVQQVCPDSLSGEDRQRCVAQHVKRLPLPCQQIVRQRMVRWKEAEGYKAACAADVKRVCQGVEPGEGRILNCLQERAQDLSEGCYQSLPKGHLLLRN
jgi:Cysteine rich repeat